MRSRTIPGIELLVCNSIILAPTISCYVKGILCEVPFYGGSALLLFYSVGVMASCNYIPQKNVK